MKKYSALLLVAITALSLLCRITAYAVEPRYAYTTYVASVLTTSSNTAHCDSTANANSNVSLITATQYLEKKSGTTWSTVSGCTWSGSAKGNSLSISNTKSNLSSGTYRLRTVFKVYSGTSYETVEKTSSEVTV